MKNKIIFFLKTIFIIIALTALIINSVKFGQGLFVGYFALDYLNVVALYMSAISYNLFCISFILGSE